MSAVYVLHFDPPFKHARHYVGFTDHDDVATRLAEHLSGRGSRLVKAAVGGGVRVEIAHVFIGADRNFERRIKNGKAVPQWCRLCGVHSRKKPVVPCCE